MGIDTKANTVLGGGALERGHGASLEPLAQLGDALRGVVAVAITAELVVGQTAKEGCVSTGADTQKQKHSRGGSALELLEHAILLDMQLAMMMADATPSLLLERSIFSVGFVPLSSSIWRA